MNTDRGAPIYERESQQIVGAAIDVLNGLGHGFHEKPYENALVVEFAVRGLFKGFFGVSYLVCTGKEEELPTGFWPTE